MPAVAVATLIGVALLVVVLAGYLIRITLILRHVVLTLEVVLDAVVAVSEQSAPIGDVANAINTDLEAGHRALEAALAAHQGPQGTGQESTGVGAS